VIAHLFAKPSSDVGLVQKFTPPLLLAFDFVGGNDFDVQCKIKLHDFDQEITPESDEFHLFGEVQGTDFVPIIDIKNLSTTAFNTKQDACTQINVTINYDYFGAIEEEFLVEYHFEQTDIDVIVKTIEKVIKPDSGKNKNITDTFFLPFVEFSGEAEVTTEVLNKDGIVVGFADTEPHNTFNITADLSDDCRYREDANQFLLARSTRALENISTKTGTFRFAVLAPLTGVQGTGMEFDIELQLEDGSLNKETQITCFIEGSRTQTEFDFLKMATSSLQIITRTVNIPSNITGPQSLKCGVEYFNLGVRTDTATDTFTVVSPPPPRQTGDGSGGGGGFIGGFPSKVVEGIVQVVDDIFGPVITTGKDLIEDLFKIINKFPVISGVVLVGGLLVGREAYKSNKKDKKKKKEE